MRLTMDGKCILNEYYYYYRVCMSCAPRAVVKEERGGMQEHYTQYKVSLL